MVGTKKSSEQLMLVPESVLKKRHDLDELKRKRAASAQHQKKVANDANNSSSGKKSAFYVKKPETFLSRARNRRNNATRYRRVMKKGMQKRASNKKETTTRELEGESDNDDDETTTKSITYQSNSVGAPMVFVVRIRDDVGVPKICKNVLERMRLGNIHDGVFLRYDATTRKSLHLVEPFVVYGPPSKAMITDLIERKGHGSVNDEPVPLSDNTVIEDALGDNNNNNNEHNNIICVEDLVHELHTVGDSFDAASKFLWPFKLVDTKTHFERRTLKLKDGKDYGDRGDAINDYIKEVL